MALLNDSVAHKEAPSMHLPINTIRGRIQQDLGRHLDTDSILDVCKSIGHTWRKTILNPVTILHLFLLQVLHGNTSLQHVSLLAGRLFIASAFCQARARLPLIFFHKVLAKLVASLLGETQDQGLWRGHRVLMVDGSGLSMPDTPELQKHFGQPGNQAPGCGFPVAKILAVFHAATGYLLEVTATPLRTHEMSQLQHIHPHLRSGDVLVADRGFCSFPHLAMLVLGGIHAVFRIHQKQIVDFTPGRAHTCNRGKASRKGLPRSRWLRALGCSIRWSNGSSRKRVPSG